MLKILLVEDEPQLRNLIQTFLHKNGYDVIPAENGEVALRLFGEMHIDLLITDVMMPKMDGNVLVKELRELNKDIPVLMLTALEDIKDKEKGFLLGIDDYMVKPVNLRELVLRIKALLKRYSIMQEHKIVLPNLMMNLQTMECVVHQKQVELSKKEFQLLFRLLASPTQIFTREQLMNEVWGYDSESYERTIDTHIKRLREHVKCDDFKIVTVRGLGYKAVMT